MTTPWIRATVVTALYLVVGCGGSAAPTGGDDLGASDLLVDDVDAAPGTSDDGTKIEGECGGCWQLYSNGAPGCLPGDTDQSCGKDGLVCYACINGAHCQAGECQLPCNPDNCNGCCDAALGCVTAAQSASACGGAGSACVACAVGEACVAGSCVDATCATSCPTGCCGATGCEQGNTVAACGTGGAACAACAPGFRCGTAGCEPDPSASWNIVLLSGTVPSLTTSTTPWDSFGGLPDPFISVELVLFGSTTSLERGESATADDTLTPSWNEHVIEDVPTSALVGNNLLAHVRDDDVGLFNDYMEFCSHRVTIADFQATSLNLCDDGENATVLVKLVAH